MERMRDFVAGEKYLRGGEKLAKSINPSSTVSERTGSVGHTREAYSQEYGLALRS